MAATAAGARLTEAHRAEQAQVQDGFLAEFLAIWTLLNQDDPEQSGDAWVRAVMSLMRQFRRRSVELADEYYRAFRLAELSSDDHWDPPAALDDVAELDAAAKRSLELMGPLNVANRRRRLQPADRISANVLVQASGSAARHVANGGRAVVLRDVAQDEKALGWARVTRDNPCAFCAMLASRGPVYKTRQQAGFQPHDHCRCYPEPVFTRDAPWPGRGREFQELWYSATSGYSGRDAINAFRRAHERGLREVRRADAA